MSRVAVAMLFAVALAAPAGLAAQNQWERVVRSQIREHSGYLTDRGYDMISEVFQGRLGNHENETLTIDLQAGRAYAFLGVCDQDCRDMDLRLYDPDGDEIDSDVGDDDWPVVKVASARSGRYTIKVVMASCSTDPCYYGVGAFKK